MTITTQAYQKYIRQSPRKMRLLADMIRSSQVDEAMIQLNLSNKRAALTVGKVLTQAKANAVNNLGANPKTLVVDQVLIEEGPTYKRFQPVSRGRAHSILKRSSHIKIVIKGEAQGK